MSSRRRIEWLSERDIRVGAFSFRLSPGFKLPTRLPEETLLLLKDPPMIEEYVQLLGDEPIANLLELGIMRGGSTVFFHEWLQPERLVAIDHEEPVIPYLDCLERHGLDRIRNYFHTDQADRERLHSIVQTEFGAGALDLVIDDASHYYEESTVSFEVLFPLLRPGAWYVIEDWAWAHTSLAELEPWAGKKSLFNLVARLTMLLARRQDQIADMRITARMCAVRRGNAPLDAGFALEPSLDPRARRLNLV